MKACIYCGCTEEQACPVRCSWVSIDPPICSECRHVALRLATAVADLGGHKPLVAFGYTLLDIVCKDANRTPVKLDRWAWMEAYE